MTEGPWVVFGSCLLVDVEVAAAAAGPFRYTVARQLAVDGMSGPSAAVLAVLDALDAAAEELRVRSERATDTLLGDERTSTEGSSMDARDVAGRLTISTRHARRLVASLAPVRDRRPRRWAAADVEALARARGVA